MAKGLINASGLHFLKIFCHAKRRNEFFDTSIHDIWQVVHCLVDAVVGHTRLGIVVGADLVRAITASHHGPALGTYGFVVLG